MRSRTVLVVGLLVALLLAGVGSYYASSHPDGLQQVAAKAGFLDSADDSAASDGPFAGYTTKGVDDPRLSGGIAGVAGCLIVLVLAGGLFWGLRSRSARGDTGPATSDDEA